MKHMDITTTKPKLMTVHRDRWGNAEGGRKLKTGQIDRRDGIVKALKIAEGIAFDK